MSNDIHQDWKPINLEWNVPENLWEMTEPEEWIIPDNEWDKLQIDWE